MLHKLGNIFFLLALLTIILNFKNKKLFLKLHIITGTISCLSLVIYSIADFLKFREITMIFIGIFSAFIILSGTNKIIKKYKYLHRISIIGFVISLVVHIVN